MNSPPDLLRPCLVLGTDFHLWVLGESMQTGFEPLLELNVLLLAVARKMRVPVDRTESSLHWEQLLAAARHVCGFEREGDGRPGAAVVHRLEATAKAKAARLLARLEAAYPSGSQPAHLPSQTPWGAVISRMRLTRGSP